MAATVSKAGPYYSSGEIKFSSLRSNFRAQIRKATSSGSETFSSDTATIKASELKRLTVTTNTDPIVPDATENANISTSSNWKLSQFRGSIKYYYITQSGTDLNFDIDAQSWNSNLNKNVRKFLFVDGTCGSNDAGSPAAQLSETAYNLTVDVYGNILGASGKGGGTSGAPAISGQKGGDALEMTSTNGANNIVLVRNGSKVYGGGGGGEKGTTGADGSGGSCQDYYETGWHCQGNSPGSEKCNRGGYKCQGGWRYCCVTQGGGCAVAWWFVGCCIDYTVAGVSGGAGGNGGPGRGYNLQEPNSLAGVAGGAGSSAATCNNGSTALGATDGQPGETGGTGGEWAQSGGNTNNTENGGSPGRAIFGSNYSVTGTINSGTIKGSYT